MSIQHPACWGPGSRLNQTKHPNFLSLHNHGKLQNVAWLCIMIFLFPDPFCPPVSSSIILWERRHFILTAKQREGIMYQLPSSTPALLAVQTRLFCASIGGNPAQQRSHHLCFRRIKHRNSFCTEASSRRTILSDFKRWPNLSLLHKSRMCFLSPVQQIWQSRK